MAGTPFGLFSARGDRRAGKVWTLDNPVGVDPVVTPSRHWSHRGYQSVPGFKWHVVHVAPSDGVDERKQRSREKGGFQASWGCIHEAVSIPVLVNRRLVGKQIFGDTDVIFDQIQLFHLRDSNLQNTISKISLVSPSMEPSSVLLRPATAPARGNLATERSSLLGSLHTCEDANFRIADEVYDDHGPTWVRRNRVVKLGCEGTKSRETCPRDGWEIMMLIMISHLTGKS